MAARRRGWRESPGRRSAAGLPGRRAHTQCVLPDRRLDPTCSGARLPGRKVGSNMLSGPQVGSNLQVKEQVGSNMVSGPQVGSNLQAVRGRRDPSPGPRAQIRAICDSLPETTLAPRFVAPAPGSSQGAGAGGPARQLWRLPRRRECCRKMVARDRVPARKPWSPIGRRNTGLPGYRAQIQCVLPDRRLDPTCRGCESAGTQGWIQLAVRTTSWIQLGGGAGTDEGRQGSWMRPTCCQDRKLDPTCRRCGGAGIGRRARGCRSGLFATACRRPL